MTAQEFHHFLEAPDRLYGLPLTDLQQLALRFPYSPNLRLLLLLKAKLENHPAEAAYLERCAAAAFDRGFLYDLLREIEQGEATTPEAETLELRELDELALTPLSATSPTLSDELDIVPPSTVSFSPPPPIVEAPPVTEPEQVTIATRAIVFDTDSWVATAVAFLEAATLPPTAIPPIEGLPEASSLPETPASPSQLPASTPQGPEKRLPAAAKRNTPSLRQRLGRIRGIQEHRRQAAAGNQVNRIARRSLVAHDAVASETLARLLTQQGQYQHAIKMYRRLILLYPEKKTIFAGLIKDLQEKL